MIGAGVVDGQTWYVFSEPFQLGQGETFVVDDLTFTPTPPPIPVSMTAVANPVLVALGQTASMTVTGTLADGSMSDMTLATAWTTYVTSNPALATVSENGVVTPHTVGTVFITAKNGAATAVERVIVTAESLPTTIVGVVELEDGTPVENAVIVTPVGGESVSGPSGVFELDVMLAQRTTSLNVTAVAEIDRETYSGTVSVSPIVPGEVTDAGVVVISPPGGGKTCTETDWLPTFGSMPGTIGAVRALTVFDDGSGGGPALYAGGEFMFAGGVTANSVARWNGAWWTALGSGMNNTVSALTVFDDGSGGGPALYAGGLFTTAGGVTANRIAKWNGASWTSLSSGMNNWVFALTVFDDGSGGGPALYAGGLFTTAGGVTANHIAKWNGASWTQLSSGMNNSVSALTVFDDGSGGGPALYAGGSFTTAGGVTANRIAKWNGASWTQPSSGMNNPVSALTVFDDGSGGGPALYGGGSFTTAGGVAANRIAKWNGAAWTPLSSGMNSFVAALTVLDDGSGGGPALYAGGTFTTAGGVTANRIAKWNGAAWTPLSTGTSDAVSALTVFDDGSGGGPALYAGGDFLTAGGAAVYFIARWTGASWTTLGSGLDAGVLDLTVFDDGLGSGPALYTGGEFTAVGALTLNSIGRWDGASWTPLGSGMNAPVFALTVFDDGSGGGPALYAGGTFTTAGGVTANRIAKWNGAAWTTLGSGVNGTVFALTVFDDGLGGGPALYAGGDFTTAGGVAANRIARWNGASWTPLASGVNNFVRALTVFDDGAGGGPALHVGGSFTTAGGLAANRIARWNGAAWTPLSSGLNNSVSALTVFDDGAGGGPALYAAGQFTTAGGVAASNIAKWNGASWTPLGSGVSGSVGALTVFDDGSGAGPALYAGGSFSTAGGVTANSIASWDGVSWTPLGSGLAGFGGFVHALTVFDDGSDSGPALCVGGFLLTSPAGDSHLAKWGCVPRSVPATAAPERPAVPPALVASGVRAASDRDSGDRRVHAGDVLAIGNERLHLHRLFVEGGATLRLDHALAHLIVEDLTLEPGAILDWSAGTIEIAHGTLMTAAPLEIGCRGPASLVLEDAATLVAEQVHVCVNGEISGHGVIDAALSSEGRIAPNGDGLICRESFVQHENGVLRVPWNTEGRSSGAVALLVEADASLTGSVEVAWTQGDVLSCPVDLRVLSAATLHGDSHFSMTGESPCGIHQSVAGDGSNIFVHIDTAPSQDADCDGAITFGDVTRLIQSWGPCAPEACCSCDVAPVRMGDGVVNGDDLAVVLAALAAGAS